MTRLQRCAEQPQALAAMRTSENTSPYLAEAAAAAKIAEGLRPPPLPLAGGDEAASRAGREERCCSAGWSAEGLLSPPEGHEENGTAEWLDTAESGVVQDFEPGLSGLILE